MTPYLSIPVTEASQVGEARRAAMALTRYLGFDEIARGRVALVITELGNNLAHHAVDGRLLIGACVLAPVPTIEVLSLDHGPGMADVNACLRDGYSTASTPGTGLGAVQRLSGAFALHSVVGKGSVIVARIPNTSGTRPTAPTAARAQFAFSGICLPARGETVCGDTWHLRLDGHKARVMVADGLGHGPEAAEASEAAVAVFDLERSCTPSAVLDRAHLALRNTRGAAAAMAELDAQAGTVTFAGAGNIAGRLISGVEDRSLLSQHGTIGLQIRRLQDVVYPWPEHAFLILHSDGLTTRWNVADEPGLLRCDPAVIAGWLLRDHCRGRDDATVVVIRRDSTADAP